MIEFITSMWQTSRITIVDITRYVTKKRITQAQADIILNTPQIG